MRLHTNAKRAHRMAGGLTAAALAAALLAVVACFAPAASPQNTSPELVGRTSRFDAIDWIVDSAVARPDLKGAVVSILIEDLGSGDVLYERGADRLMVPASNMKIVTGTAALRVLGPAFTFDTAVATDASSIGKELQGDLYIVGSGDPSMVSEELWKLTEEIRLLGFERVNGDLVLDAGHFDTLATTSSAVSEGDRAYDARTGALSLNFNAVAVRTSPGARPGSPAVVRLSPETSFVEIRNKATTTKAGGRTNLNVRRTFENGRNVVTVEGSIPAGAGPALSYRNLDDGIGYFGAVLRDFLSRAGVAISGEVVKGRTPPGATVLVTHSSKPLALIVRDLNKFSNNFVAEQLLKEIGARVSGPPGTTGAGTRALGGYLTSAGIDSASFRIVDGSGISRENRLSPRTIVKVLRSALSDFGISYEYGSSLSVSGVDGTLEDRMGFPRLRGEIRAKTGLLDGVTAISGIMETASGERLVFSIMVNGFGCDAWHAHDLEQAILTAASRS
jgi:serine-type D-Ala-D-Ala carboxypeptidase/endopeptidase (penicillin-binding protein 4)